MDNHAFELIKEKLDDLSKDVKDIRKDLDTYKGFFGGVLFVFTSLWTIVTYWFNKPEA